MSFPILFATDGGYSPHLCTAIFSLLQNNKSLKIRLIVFTATLSKDDRNKIHEVCDRFRVPLEFVFLESNLFDGLILNHHFNKSNYYRLLAADLIDDDKCLYLDADIIVTGSILEIINTDLNNKYLAAVENPGFNRHKDLGMDPKSRYFNSGVMLLNLDMWRRSNLKVRVVDLIKEKNEAIHFVDQCGLNGVVDGEWIDLDARYNYQSSMLNTFKNKGDSAHQNPVIVHFTGSSKPWQIGDRHPYKKIYWHFRNQTPYRNHRGSFFSLLSFASLITPNFFKGYVKRIIGGKL